MNVPQDLRYTREHEWVRRSGDLLVIGITEHAQSQLGDVVYVELPSLGIAVQQGQVFGTVESVKAVSDLYAPVSGTVCAVNERLTDEPELVNRDPYGSAWMLEIKPSAPEELESLLGADAYAQLLGA
jgi:glycine cleavage system H protein